MKLSNVYVLVLNNIKRSLALNLKKNNKSYAICFYFYLFFFYIQTRLILDKIIYILILMVFKLIKLHDIVAPLIIVKYHKKEITCLTLSNLNFFTVVPMVT